MGFSCYHFLVSKFFTNLALTLISFFLTLLFVEFGPVLLRIHAFSPKELQEILNDNQLWPYDEEGTCKGPLPSRSRNIVVLGGSSAWGYPDGPTTSFSAQLAEFLNQQGSGVEYQVHNFAMPGRDSTYMRRCAFAFAQNRPDYFVLYDGHNDFINASVENPHWRVFLEEHPRILRWALFWRDHSRSTAWMRLLLKSSKAGTVSPGLTPLAFQQNKRFLVERFLRNVEAIAGLARKNEKKVILVTSVSNLTDYPPLKSFLSPAELNAHAHYKKGQELFSAGRETEALSEFRAARDLDTQGWRAYSELNEAMRQYAREKGDSVILVDFERILENVAPHKLVGCGFFLSTHGEACDPMHPTPLTHRLMAEAIFARIREIESASLLVAQTK
jgi:lysophospholipase L1-like esterase